MERRPRARVAIAGRCSEARDDTRTFEEWPEAFPIVPSHVELYIIVKVFQDSVMWGLFFLIMPIAYYPLTTKVSPVIAAVIVIGLQLYYVKNHWNTVGKPYVALVVLIGASVLGQLALAR